MSRTGSARRLFAVSGPSPADIALASDDMLTIKQVGEMIGLRSRSRILELLRAKGVRICKLTRFAQVPRSEVVRIMAESMTGGTS